MDNATCFCDHFSRQNLANLSAPLAHGIWRTLGDLAQNIQKASELVRRQYLKFVSLTALSLYLGVNGLLITNKAMRYVFYK
jgi:hypothetical protein